MKTISQVTAAPDDSVDISIIVPLYNEADNVASLVEETVAAMATQRRHWELILIDDGSTDGTDRRIVDLSEQHPGHVGYLLMQRNFGQTAAMQAGIDAASGGIIVTMDGDLQNDPADIPGMVAHLLDRQLDMVAGWRKDRKDNGLTRKLPSRIANRIIGRITGLRLHDYGCSLKVFQAAIIKNIPLHGEMHRFIPAWVASRTATHRIGELAVNHRPRRHGESKYGLSRTFRVIVDMLAMYFFMNFLGRPGHFFGRLGLLFGALGSLALGWLLLEKLQGNDIGSRPLLLTGVMLVILGVQFLSTGVMSEMLSRVYYSTGNQRTYVIRKQHAPEPPATDE